MSENAEINIVQMASESRKRMYMVLLSWKSNRSPGSSDINVQRQVAADPHQTMTTDFGCVFACGQGWNNPGF